MDKAICFECVEDCYLKEIIKDEGELLNCSICGEENNNAITVEQLGKLMEPIMREHFSLGPTVKKFGNEDEEWWEQEGDSMSWAVQEVLGQYFDFEDEIVDAVIEAEDAWPPDGDEAFWDRTNLYVESRVRLGHYFAEWQWTLDELKHSKRFFSTAAQVLFGKLFNGVEDLKLWNSKSFQPVVRRFPSGTKLFRARICSSRSMLDDIYADPFKFVGPPPKQNARAGRMDAEGVVVFYAASEEDTCLAEIRPAIGNDIAIMEVVTTEPLRVLDFSRLEQARSGKALSYFQPDFTEQVEKRSFLRHIHRLISQPVVPGHESDYLITQTMSEYLAHVHQNPFDGILFASAQRKKGTNVVLFAKPNLLTDSPAEAFRLSYVSNSVRLYSTTSIKYKHHEISVRVGDDGKPWVYHEPGDEADDEWIG
jgi:hypothetical protein